MISSDAVESALRSSAPVRELRALAERLLAEGTTSQELLGMFEQVRRRLREEDREREEDAVMDVMDFLTGFCSPHVQLPQPVLPSSNRDGNNTRTQN